MPLANRSAALAAIAAETATRLVFFALVPTTYGVEDTLLYFPNEVFTASFGGVLTFISPIVALTTYLAVTLATTGAFAPERTAPAVPAALFSEKGCRLAGPTVRFRGGPHPPWTGDR